MNNRYTKCLLIGSILSLLPVASIAAPMADDIRDSKNLLLKESFENLRDTKGWNVLRGDVVGDHGIVWDTHDHGVELQRGVVSKSADGEVHIELDSHNNGKFNNVTISTELDFVNTKQHILKLSIKPRAKGGKKDTSAIEVSLGNDVVSILSDVSGNLTKSDDSSNMSVSMKETNDGWTRVAIRYATVNKSENTLTIKGIGRDDTYGMLVDDISLRFLTPSTPKEEVDPCEDLTKKKVILEESFENLRDIKGWHVAYGEVIGDHDIVWDTHDNGVELQRGIVSKSAKGRVHIELDAHNNVQISTELDLLKKRRYIVTFFVKARGKQNKKNKKDTSAMEVSLGGNTVTITSNKRGKLKAKSSSKKMRVKLKKTKSMKGWTKVRLVYRNTQDGLTTLDIKGIGADDSFGMLLDNIKIIRTKKKNKAPKSSGQP